MMLETLFDAIKKHDHERVRQLLSGGLNLDEPDSDGWMPLHVAIGQIGSGGSIETVELLIKHGADVNQWDINHYETPLMSSSVAGGQHVMKLLLESGADPNVRNCVGDSPLRLCVWENEPGMVEMLLKYGAASSIDDYGGDLAWTALGIAAHNFNIPIIKLLLKAGANPQATDDIECTARDRLPAREEHDQRTWDEVMELLGTRH